MKYFVPHLFPLLFLLLFQAIYAENAEEYRKASNYLSRKGEVYFQFHLPGSESLESLTRIVSIDNVKEGMVYAYANSRQFAKFRKLGIDYATLAHPGELIPSPKMYDFNKDGSKAWDAYPTYESYESIMYQFAAEYPDLCRIVDAGNTVENRKILFAVISDNVTAEEAEPNFMYTATMHGDETLGYILMLHLIDSLLTGYSEHDDIRSLVNNTVFWINPLANPDGTYAGGNNTVSGATRYNANNVDLNRNFPNQVAGEHPDGEAWQPETEIMMTIAAAAQFTLSANFHGGAELVNYPWDSWTSSTNISPDDAFWQYVSREYVDTIHTYGPAGYMTDQNNGITNGGDWYIVYGSRQDYMNYYHRCREVTIEMSHIKLVPAAELENFWDYNRRSLLNYIKRVASGIRGTITDEETGDPVRAKITVLNHDRDNTEVFSGIRYGDFYRPIQSGTFTLDVRAEGYLPLTVPVTTSYANPIILDLALTPQKTTDKIMLTGNLLTSGGTPVGSTAPVTYDVTVRLHAHATENALRYTENFLAANSQGVTINNGNFQIALGNGTSSDNLQNVLLDNNNLWVEIVVDSDQLTRIPLTASPFTLTY